MNQRTTSQHMPGNLPSRLVAWLKEICGPDLGKNKVQHRFLLVSWIIFAAIGLFIPETIITDHTWARSFSDFMASIVPQIDRVTAIGLRPGVNRFHYSILWAVSPVYFLILFISTYKNIRAHRKQPKSFWPLVLGVCLSGVCIAFSMFLYIGIGFVGPDDRNSIVRIMFFYPITRAINGPLFVMIFWMGVIFLTVVVRPYVLTIYERITRSGANA